VSGRVWTWTLGLQLETRLLQHISWIFCRSVTVCMKARGVRCAGMCACWLPTISWHASTCGLAYWLSERHRERGMPVMLSDSCRRAIRSSGKKNYKIILTGYSELKLFSYNILVVCNCSYFREITLFKEYSNYRSCVQSAYKFHDNVRIVNTVQGETV